MIASTLNSSLPFIKSGEALCSLGHGYWFLDRVKEEMHGILGGSSIDQGVIGDKKRVLELPLS